MVSGALRRRVVAVPGELGAVQLRVTPRRRPAAPRGCCCVRGYRGRSDRSRVPSCRGGTPADDEGRFGGVGLLLPAVEMEGDQGDGLAQVHVVGEAAAEAERGHPVQPAQAAQWVVAESRPQCGGLLGPGVPRVGAGDSPAQVRQPAAGGDLGRLAVDLGGAGQGRGKGVHGGQGRRLAAARLAHQVRVAHRRTGGGAARQTVPHGVQEGPQQRLRFRQFKLGGVVAGQRDGVRMRRYGGRQVPGRVGCRRGPAGRCAMRPHPRRTLRAAAVPWRPVGVPL